MRKSAVIKFVAHSRTVLSIALRHGWKPGARYTNLRDVRHLSALGFLDIDWQNYSFDRHLDAARSFKPLMTVARDVMDRNELDTILHEASLLAKHSEHVVVVPKDLRLRNTIEKVIPPEFVLGYSVPTRYGATQIALQSFKGRVHFAWWPPGRTEASSRGNERHKCRLQPLHTRCSIRRLFRRRNIPTAPQRGLPALPSRLNPEH
jgi:hypothetical protein